MTNPPSTAPDGATADSGVKVEAFSEAPWTLEQPERWPFPLYIKASDGKIVVDASRIATSTRQNDLADCLDAIGFRPEERPAVVESLRRQIADFRLIAAAPDLLEQLRNLTGLAKTGVPLKSYGAAIRDAEAAIAKAESRS